MAPFRIALLGARRSGKTRLASELDALLIDPATAESGSYAHLFHFDDNPPLLEGITAGLHAQDIAQAAQQHRNDFRMTLLMGLDLAQADFSQADNEQFDRALREQLTSAGIAYQVVYGQGDQRTAHALQALAPLHSGRFAGALIPGLTDQEPTGQSKPEWLWVCEKCSDPVCEHRLFTDLLSQRKAADLSLLQR